MPRRRRARPVTATYRLQIRGAMTLERARDLVEPLASLCISHLYASPLTRARKGSTHGYDVVDPNEIDPALGGRSALEELSRALRARRMGIVLDIVPNHMAADLENRAFYDVLAHGPASRFAEWLDIDWRIQGPSAPVEEPRRAHARLVLPALGESLQRAARLGRLRLVLHEGFVRLRYGDRLFPLDPATLPAVLEHAAAARGPSPDALALEAISRALAAVPLRTATDAVSRMRRAEATAQAEHALAALIGGSARSRAAVERALAAFSHGRSGLMRLQALLDRQTYSLGFWRRAQRVVNYRRFFNVHELIALRTEDPAVFAAVHALVFKLAARGTIDGLRIDHIDGLLEPGGYLVRLRDELARHLGPRAAAFVLLVEKILARDERLPAHWPVEGTTGYDFLDELEECFVAHVGYRRIVREWSDLTGLPSSFDVVARAEKRRVLRFFAPDLRRLARMLAEAGIADLTDAIGELIVRLPVYRPYVGADGRTLTPDSRRRLERTLAELRHEWRGARDAVETVARALQLSSPLRMRDGREASARFIGRFGQVSGPIAAKGIEDAAFYVHVPLASRNEVGADPGTGADEAGDVGVRRFHARNRERARIAPSTMLALTTHDTKRSSDARSRIDVLSEIPDEWLAALERWRRWNARHRSSVRGRPVPDPNTEYSFYQALLAIWPIVDPISGERYRGPSRAQLPPLLERMHRYTEKAAREAGHMTDWLAPDTRWEQALHAFIDAVLASSTGASPFVRDMSAFVARVARPGLWNSLGKLCMQLASPGIVDVYQGDELWTFALVDPDNRRDVDFARTRRELAALERGVGPDARASARRLQDLVDNAEDGRIKLYVLRQGLRLRRRHPELFVGGEYLEIGARGAAERHVIAIARRAGERLAIASATRLSLTLTGDASSDPVGESTWQDTEIVLPIAFARRRFRCVLSGAVVEPTRRGDFAILACADLHADLPVALLVSSES